MISLMQNQEQTRTLEPIIFFLSYRPAKAETPVNVSIEKSEKAPTLTQLSPLAKLKMPLTGVKDSWKRVIRPYLNNSEFIEIARKSNSLVEERPSYGQTVLDYESSSMSRIFSRAYFKLLQVLHLGILDKYKHEPIRIACLAEGPGGFLNCLTDYRRNTQDNYFAITLKGSKDNLSNDWSFERAAQYLKNVRQQGHRICLSYGVSGTGDLTDPNNIRHFSAFDLGGMKCQLVTADGGMDCCNDDEYTYQELVNCRLFFAQVLTALAIQEQGGCFFLKMYDWQFELTRKLLVLLSRHYEKLCVIKPVTSRPANSQRYVLCEGFLGCDHSTIDGLMKVLEEWNKTEKHQLYFMNKRFIKSFLTIDPEADGPILKNLGIANNCLVDRQIVKLKDGIELSAKLSYRQLLHELMTKRKQQQIAFARSWCQAYSLPYL